MAPSSSQLLWIVDICSKTSGLQICYTRRISGMAIKAEQYAPFRKRLKALTKGAEHIHQGDIESLHHTRVASRRLRELVPLLELDSDSSRKLSEQLGKVTKRLGKVRQLDVLMIVIQELSRDGAYSSMALNQLGADVEKARIAARERLATKLPAERLEGIVAKLQRVAQHLKSNDRKGHRRTGRGPSHAWLWALEARVAHRATRVRSAIQAAGAMYVPERLHDIRIAVKKLRYAAELLAEARHQRVAAAIGTLRTAQDLLGRVHDLQVLIERIGELQASSSGLTADEASSSDLTADHQLGSLAQALEVDCRRLHARYMRNRAKLIAIADRMGGAQHVDLTLIRRVAS